MEGFYLDTPSDYSTAMRAVPDRLNCAGVDNTRVEDGQKDSGEKLIECDHFQRNKGRIDTGRGVGTGPADS